jgi:hypothetical protein
MGRFIVRFRRDTAARDAIVERLHASPEVVVVEETPRMVLVEANDKALRQLIPDSDDVAIVPERHYERPNPPLTVEKKQK